jgi:Xylose isomerase-like TIM barrel
MGDGQQAGAEFFDRMAAAGISGFEANCQSEQAADELAVTLRDRGMQFGYAAGAGDLDDLLPALELAHRMRADYLSVRVAGSLKSSPRIAELLGEMYELVNDAGLPLLVETCAGTVTQDLRRTVKVAKRLKKVRFTADFMHYVIAGDMPAAWSEEVWEHFQRIAEKCGNWRGRFDGDAAGEMGQGFKKLWAMGFKRWLGKARAGDVLPFCCEAEEWERILAIKRLAEEAWAQAVSAPPAQIAAEQGMH